MRILKKLLILTLVPALTFMLMSGGGGKKEGKADLGNGCNVVEKNTTLVLYPFYTPPTGRNTAWGATIPAVPSLWTGAQSATSLYDNPSTKYYCVVTVTSTCGDYNKSYTWNAVSGSNNTMTVPVPENVQFRLSVEYWEQCGPYWGSNSSPSYKRGLWFSETNQGYSTTISISNWLFLRSENC